MRAFIGIPLSTPAREAVARLQQQLGAAGADVRWIPPESLHLTLKFLGSIDAAQHHATEALLHQAASETGSCSMSLAGLGAFPASGAPRIVWVGVGEGREALTRFAEGIRAQGRGIGWPEEERAFAAHVTIGRFRSPRGAAALRRALSTAAWTAPPAWTVSEVVLFESCLAAGGSRYTPRGTFPLTGPRATA